jgi:retinol-binding protein 3
MPRLLATLALAFTLLNVQAQSLDAATRARVVERTISQIRDCYVDPSAATKIEAALRDRHSGLDEFTDGEAFAERLTMLMQSVVPDRHLHVEYSAELLTNEAAPTASELALRHSQDEQANYGVERVERLSGNIGYVDLRSFSKTDWAAETLAASMTVVAHTDALIIDLRRNGGGYPATAALVESYLFDKRTHVVDVFWRDGQRTEQFWTQDSVPGLRFGGTKPVWVLTSKATFSGAEQFAYDLKNLKRATLVGETTGGGANPGKFVTLDDHFGLVVPTGRAISPITHSNWEGIGVEPDVRVEEEKALQIAHRLALESLVAAASDAANRQSLQDILATLR